MGHHGLISREGIQKTFMAKNNRREITQERIDQLILKCSIEKNNASSTALEDKNLIARALTHSSYNPSINHEKLEFLGDAVLRLACSEFLHEYDPSQSVGKRSLIRAQLVSDRWLYELAQMIDLGSFICQSPAAAHDKAAHSRVLAECCEALIGAIYLTWGGADGGLHAVRQWLDPYWLSSCNELDSDPHRHNWKSALQEFTQSQKFCLPVYVTTEESKSHGDPRRFHSKVSINDERQGSGWGASRRLAEQQAARDALEQLRPPSGS